MRKEERCRSLPPKPDWRISRMLCRAQPRMRCVDNKVMGFQIRLTVPCTAARVPVRFDLVDGNNSNRCPGHPFTGSSNVGESQGVACPPLYREIESSVELIEEGGKGGNADVQAGRGGGVIKVGENGISQIRREGTGMGRYGPHYRTAVRLL